LIHSVVRATSKLGYQSHLLWARWYQLLPWFLLSR
jgi:hypothetical protein